MSKRRWRLMEIKRIEHECLGCGASFSVDKSMCKDGMSCPACKGKLNAVGIETVTIYADGKPFEEPPLLSIELQDESSVPTVYYKGEEVKYKRNVFLDWDTDTDVFGGLSYAIEHMEVGNKEPTVNRIERRVKGHAMDY